MSSPLPAESSPLNQHSLRALEQWLLQLGAIRIDNDPCRWRLERPAWSAVLLLDREDLKVIWQASGTSSETQCSLPYGLSRADVEAAIQAGP